MASVTNGGNRFIAITVWKKKLGFDGNARTSEVGFNRNIASCHYKRHIGYFKDNDEG